MSADPFQEARRRQQKRRLQLSRRRALPQVGDLIPHPGSSQTVLAWALIQNDQERFLAIPADDHVLVGPHDLAVPRSALSGPLVLRCGLSAWLPATALSSQQPIGRLEEAYVRLACQCQAGQDFLPAAGQLETAHDPDYLAWLGQVEAARHQFYQHYGHVAGG